MQIANYNEIQILIYHCCYRAKNENCLRYNYMPVKKCGTRALVLVAGSTALAHDNNTSETRQRNGIWEVKKGV